MDPLKDWYEYLDKVSRPVRRASDAEAQTPQPWRPWGSGEEPEKIAGAVDPDQVPDLFAGMAGMGGTAAGTCLPASRDFEDPTLHDQLEPIPDYAVPDFSAPDFAVEKPSLIRREEASGSMAPNAEMEPAAEVPKGTAPRQPAEAGSKGGASLGYREAPAASAASAVQTSMAAAETIPGRDAATQARDYRALMTRVRRAAPTLDGVPASTRETREDLLHKLVDPTLTLEETALILGVCTTTVRRYTNSGRLAHYRTGGNQRRFHLSDVLAFMEGHRSEGDAETPVS